MYVVGVDGCPRGQWIAIQWSPSERTFDHLITSSFAEILSTYSTAAAITVDIPIGLRDDCLPRTCDLQARQLLGPRKSSVFPAPSVHIAGLDDYWEVQRINREFCGKGTSKQAFMIFPRICEVNEALTISDQNRVVEIHPELCFWKLNGERPMSDSKHTPPGFENRLSLLRAKMEVDIPGWNRLAMQFGPAKPGDVLDALAAAWSAHRLATRVAQRIPEGSEIGANGLRMEMVY